MPKPVEQRRKSPSHRPRPRKGARSGKGDVSAAFERLHSIGEHRHYVLRLYVTGSTPRSTAAINNIRKLCDEYLKDHYELEVVDIYQQPVLAQDEQIIAAPTLVKKLPSPLRKLVGDLSNEKRVLIGLDLRSKSGEA